MKLLLIRHGEMQGDPFVCPKPGVTGCLSRSGVAQAKAARAALADGRIDVAWSSPYGRALQTAEIIVAPHGILVQVLPFLREWEPDRGFDKLPATQHEEIVRQVSNLHPEEAYKTDLGEGTYDMYARIVPPFLKALDGLGVHHRMGGYVVEEKAKGWTIAVFAHGGSLNIILSFLLNVRPFPFGCFSFEHTGLARLDFVERKGIHYPYLVLPACSAMRLLCSPRKPTRLPVARSKGGAGAMQPEERGHRRGEGPVLADRPGQTGRGTRSLPSGAKRSG
jgi:broad specificity phosphatase PhoE